MVPLVHLASGLVYEGPFLLDVFYSVLCEELDCALGPVDSLAVDEIEKH